MATPHYSTLAPKWNSSDVAQWTTRMSKEAKDLDVTKVRQFLNKYNKRNGCPFNTMVISGDTDAIFIGVEAENNPKRPITSPRSPTKKLKIESISCDAIDCQ
jgi:hypothetical protein